MSPRVAINGFGRTGRAAFRAAHQRQLDLEWAGINDLMDRDMLAHLLRHDSVYGAFPGTVEVTADGIRVDGRDIPVTDESDPGALPWADENVDVVIESTGRLREREQAARHLVAGARKVIISAPAKGTTGADVTVALGVNFDEAYDARRARRHLQCLVHDELPRTGGQGAARGPGDPPRLDDHRPRVHRRPARCSTSRTRTCVALAPPRST